MLLKLSKLSNRLCSHNDTVAMWVRGGAWYKKTANNKVMGRVAN